MKKILIVTSQAENFSAFTDGLNQKETVDIQMAGSSEAAIDHLSEGLPNLIVIDETVAGISGLTLARNILMKNAMANQVLVSPLSAEDFHEASEGLGIMYQLPPVPDATESEKVLDILAQMP